MAKYISFNVVSSADSTITDASAYQDGVSLVPTDQVSGVFQAAPATATIQLNTVAAADVITVVAGTTSFGAATAPTSVSSANLKHSIQYALSANPGGVVANVSPGFDTGFLADGVTASSGLRMYWRSFIQE